MLQLSRLHQVRGPPKFPGCASSNVPTAAPVGSLAAQFFWLLCSERLRCDARGDLVSSPELHRQAARPVSVRCLGGSRIRGEATPKGRLLFRISRSGRNSRRAIPPFGLAAGSRRMLDPDQRARRRTCPRAVCRFCESAAHVRNSAAFFLHSHFAQRRTS